MNCVGYPTLFEGTVPTLAWRGKRTAKTSVRNDSLLT